MSMKIKKTHIFFLVNQICHISELLPFSNFFILLHCKPMEACDNISQEPLEPGFSSFLIINKPMEACEQNI